MTCYFNSCHLSASQGENLYYIGNTMKQSPLLEEIGRCRMAIEKRGEVRKGEWKRPREGWENWSLDIEEADGLQRTGYLILCYASEL